MYEWVSSLNPSKVGRSKPRVGDLAVVLTGGGMARCQAAVCMGVTGPVGCARGSGDGDPELRAVWMGIWFEQLR